MALSKLQILSILRHLNFNITHNPIGDSGLIALDILNRTPNLYTTKIDIRYNDPLFLESHEWSGGRWFSWVLCPFGRKGWSDFTQPGLERMRQKIRFLFGRIKVPIGVQKCYSRNGRAYLRIELFVLSGLA